MAEKKEILVAKFGSSSITNDEGIDAGRVASGVDQLTSLRDRFTLVVVHSGAVAAGRAFTIQTVGEKAGDEMDDVDRASAGSALITAEFQRQFGKRGVLSGQGLLTHKEIDAEKKSLGQSVAERVKRQLAMSFSMVPLVNENDFVSDTELKKLAYGGDNDGLASHIARAIGADRLLLLTNRDGFEVAGVAMPRISYTEDADLIRGNILPEDGNGGTGGILSKVEAAAEFVGDREDRAAHIGNIAADYATILADLEGTRVVQ